MERWLLILLRRSCFKIVLFWAHHTNQIHAFVLRHDATQYFYIPSSIMGRGRVTNLSVNVNLAPEQVLKPLSGNWMVKVLTDVVLGYEGVTLQLCFNSILHTGFFLCLCGSHISCKSFCVDFVALNTPMGFHQNKNVYIWKLIL